ncbi:hypothetical protein T12_15843 [Trichinella patagoniensis]|uniref:Uncharacterized protein n=1 Tax=Trichinella patagoniensis TaxID=990121 RepID=A0A0V1A9Q5_9BILA|nr:hypothetical protein T12_15843 [Trichinella patagoniensis]
MYNRIETSNKRTRKVIRCQKTQKPHRIMRFSNKTILNNLIAFDNLDSVNNVPLVVFEKCFKITNNVLYIMKLNKTQPICFICKVTDGGTRTRNLRLRRPAPYPLGHIGFEILFLKILREM